MPISGNVQIFIDGEPFQLPSAESIQKDMEAFQELCDLDTAWQEIWAASADRFRGEIENEYLVRRLNAWLAEYPGPVAKRCSFVQAGDWPYQRIMLRADWRPGEPRPIVATFTVGRTEDAEG